MACFCPGKSRFYLWISIIGIFQIPSVYSQVQIVTPRSFQIEQSLPAEHNAFVQDKINAVLLSGSSAGKKSVGKAFFYSLLLPGLGEAYTGHPGYTKFFLSVEGIGWGFFLSNYLQVTARTEDNENYALQHAGVTRTGKDAQYWINIGKYDNIYDYNEQKRRERDVDGLYSEDTVNFWRWDSYNNRLYYDWKRIQTREMERRQVYIIGALVLNHTLSAINALRLARAYNKESERIGWKFDVSVHPYYSAIVLNLSKTF